MRADEQIPYKHDTLKPYYDNNYRHHDAIHNGREAEWLAKQTDAATAKKFSDG